MTTIDHLKQHAPDLIKEPAFQGDPKLLQQIQEAMTRYAEEKARDFSSWVCNQVVAGRTYAKLWIDYLEEHPLQ